MKPRKPQKPIKAKPSSKDPKAPKRASATTPPSAPPQPPRQRRPNLGEAMPTARTRQRVQSSYLASLLGLVDKRVTLAAEKKRREAKRQLSGSLSLFKRLTTAATGAAADLFTRARSTLTNLGSLVQSSPLFDTPVSQLRVRPTPQTMQVTPQSRPMIGVSSSNVFSFGFDPDPNNPNYGTLYVQFRSESRVYAYYDCPLWIVQGLRSTRSPGRYVWDFIRPLYDGTSNYARIA